MDEVHQDQAAITGQVDINDLSRSAKSDFRRYFPSGADSYVFKVLSDAASISRSLTV